MGKKELPQFVGGTEVTSPMELANREYHFQISSDIFYSNEKRTWINTRECQIRKGSVYEVEVRILEQTGIHYCF